MALQYDINRIFAELEQKAKKKEQQQKEEKENNPIESPEDAPQTQEVKPATLKIFEEIHGGDEISKEIKDSPNSANNGEDSNKEKRSEKTQGSGKKLEQENIEDIEHTLDTFEIKGHNENQSEVKQKALQETVARLFKEIRKSKEDFKNQHKPEYLKKYILEIIKKIAAQHAGIDKQDGDETFDKKQMLQHIVKKQNYKLLGDKYDLRDARYVQFFIDTSGVYGCGSNKILHELMPEVIGVLEKQGYECYIAACGNGFYQRDMYEDKYYGTRKTLEGYRTGKVSKIACPTPQTAAKMANEAEFSVILADFDGLSSICEMANLCEKDKVPYFLCTEDRYPWEDPTLHDWVDPNLCDYNLELVYDVSMDGNPTLEQYEDRQFQYNEYEQEEEYEQESSRDYND